MSSKYIIFQDNDLKGYLNDEGSAVVAVSNLAKAFINELKQKPSPSPMRVFTENVDNGIKIYSQVLGAFYNSSVSVESVIEYKEIQEIIQK